MKSIIIIMVVLSKYSDVLDACMKQSLVTKEPLSSLFSQFLVGCVHWVFPDFTFQWLADEVRQNLPMELDFYHEAQNQEKFSEMFSHLTFVKAPRVHWEFTTKRVLTMEFCEGEKVNNMEYIEGNGLRGDDVSD